jgi:bifunctional DNA-binding transcriptional regulator/antitoxin component of YhaV-PrlF toxin-antitoxin module
MTSIGQIIIPKSVRGTALENISTREILNLMRDRSRGKRAG